MFLFQPKHKVLLNAIYDKPNSNQLSILIHHIHLKRTRLTKISEALHSKMRHTKNIKLTCNIFITIMREFPEESMLYEEYAILSIKRAMKRCEERLIIDVMDEIQQLGIKSFKGEHNLTKLVKEISKAMELIHKKSKSDDKRQLQKADTNKRSSSKHKKEAALNNKQSRHDNRDKSYNKVEESDKNKSECSSDLDSFANDRKDKSTSSEEGGLEAINDSEESSSHIEASFTSDRDNFLVDLLKVISAMNILNFEFSEKIDRLMNILTLSTNLEKSRFILANLCRALNIVNVKKFCYSFFWYATSHKFYGIDVILENISEDILSFLIIEGNRFLGENSDEVRQMLEIEIVARDQERIRKEEEQRYLTVSNVDVRKIAIDKKTGDCKAVKDEQTAGGHQIGVTGLSAIDPDTKCAEGKRLRDNSSELNKMQMDTTLRHRDCPRRIGDTFDTKDMLINEIVLDQVDEQHAEMNNEQTSENLEILSDKTKQNWCTSIKDPGSTQATCLKDFEFDKEFDQCIPDHNQKTGIRQEKNEGKNQIISDNKVQSIIQTYEYLKNKDKPIIKKDESKTLKSLVNKMKSDNLKEDEEIEKEQEKKRDSKTKDDLNQKINDLTIKIKENSEKKQETHKKNYINTEKTYGRNMDAVKRAPSLESNSQKGIKLYGDEIFCEYLNKYANRRTMIALQWLYTPISMSRIASRHVTETAQSFFFLFKQCFNRYKKFNKDDPINVEMNVYCNIGYLNQKYTDNDFLMSHDEKDLFILKYLHVYIYNCEFSRDVLYLFVKKSFQEQLLGKSTVYTECFQKFMLFIVGKYAIEGRCKFNCKFFILLIRISTTIPIHKEICYWLIDKGCDYYEAEHEEIITILGKLRAMYNTTNNRFLYRALVKLIDFEIKETLAVIYLTDRNKCKMLMQEIDEPAIFDEVGCLTYNKTKDEERYNEMCGNINMYTQSIKSSLNMRTFSDKRKSRIGGLNLFRF